jgi:hypothetical protein
MDSFIVKHRLEPMAGLQLDGEFRAKSMQEARLQCCSLGMIPDGRLSAEEEETLKGVYEDTYMRSLLLKSFESFNR